MRKDQKFTPKYWVFHDLDTSDVFLFTACKSLDNAKEMARKKIPAAYEEWLAGTGNYAFALVEIRIVESEELPQ